MPCYKNYNISFEHFEKHVLPLSVRGDPLADKNVFSIIASYNNFRDFNQGLEVACRGGHEHLAQVMIDQGAKDFNRGLAVACSRGQKHMVQMMMGRGANNFGESLAAASRYGCTELAIMMINKKVRKFDLNYALFEACKRGHEDLAIELINRGADDIKWGAGAAIKNKHEKLAVTIVALEAKKLSNGFNRVADALSYHQTGLLNRSVFF